MRWGRRVKRQTLNLQPRGDAVATKSSNAFLDPDWVAKVTLPVKRVGDRWEFFYGGDVPVKDGTLGELTLSADWLTDERFKQWVMQERLIKVLDEGAELRVALSDVSANGQRIGEWPEPNLLRVPAGTTRFEPIWLGPIKPKEGRPPLSPDMERGGLWLKLKALKKCELLTSTVRLPEGCSVPAGISLKHAFTVLSERSERHRISHTGNVYARVFYKERNNRWYPFDDLRRGVQAEAERELLSSTWQEVERVLGWRPLAPSNERKRSKRQAAQ
jgi:hypothetical protein